MLHLKHSYFYGNNVLGEIKEQYESSRCKPGFYLEYLIWGWMLDNEYFGYHMELHKLWKKMPIMQRKVSGSHLADFELSWLCLV